MSSTYKIKNLSIQQAALHIKQNQKQKRVNAVHEALAIAGSRANTKTKIKTEQEQRKRGKVANTTYQKKVGNTILIDHNK